MPGSPWYKPEPAGEILEAKKQYLCRLTVNHWASLEKMRKFSSDDVQLSLVFGEGELSCLCFTGRCLGSGVLTRVTWLSFPLQNDKPLGHSASRSSNISKVGSPTSVTAPRSLSQTSVSPSDQDICRICHCEGDDEGPLIMPCHCTGSLRYVHQACLQQWIKSSDTHCCELCKYEFIMETKLKPLRKVCMKRNMVE
ncbi:hypothetical protein scyTo_0003641 [Scyliorhinus torazame]|uniref:RING-type E3 ubiquitin transferase n=1 Tax=Scyliorhinus torazame TaxID=75743 RepID=A0A401PN33_SCYTO|nr:hypothetical protein [Scyliorhinus torazame]